MPEPTLPTTALRYAAGDLTAAETAAFEARLADDQDARDALAEAVRLSAAAIGQPPLAPHSSLRAILRARLSWQRDRGRPLAWGGLGAAVVAVCTLVGVSLADRAEPVAQAPAPVASAAPTEPVPARPEVAVEFDAHAVIEHPAGSACGGEPGQSVAEIWADLSTHDHVEKARDDEQRWRQKIRDLAPPHNVSTTNKADAP